MPTNDGPFSPPIGSQTDAGGLAVFEDTLFSIANGEAGTRIAVALCDLTAPDLKDPSAWKNYWLSGTQLGLDQSPRTTQPASAVVLPSGAPSHVAPHGPALYFLWAERDKHQNVFATWTTDHAFDANATWSQHVKLYTDESLSDHLDSTNERGVIAYVFDKTLVVMTLSNTHLIAHAYLPGDIAKHGDEIKWPARGHWSVTGDALEKKFGKFEAAHGKLANDFAADWFTDGDTNFVAIALRDSDRDRMNLLILPLDADGLPTLKGGAFKRIDQVHHGVGVRRDPAGRIRLYFADADNTLRVETLSTSKTNWLALTERAALNGASATLQGAAMAAFLYGPALSVGQTTSRACSEVVIYAEHGSKDFGRIQCQIAPYGTVETVERADDVDYSRMQTLYPLILTGMADPFPIAASDTHRVLPGSALMATEYGVSSSVETSRSVRETTKLATRTSGNILVNGMGVGWEASYSAGPTRASGSSEKIVHGVTEQSFAVGGGGEVDPNGALFATRIRICRDAYQMRDLSGAIVEDGAQMTMIYPQQGVKAGDTFKVWLGQAGDLCSWTRSKVNDRMNALFSEESAYRKAYPWTHYVEDVIEKNAAPIGEDGNRFLEFALSGSGWSADHFSRISTEFIETGWTVSKEALGGLVVEQEASFWGLGFKVAMEAMVGSTFEAENTVGTETTQSWGITVSQQSNTLAIQEPYTVRLYLLNASTQWTAELLAARDAGYTTGAHLDRIDPSSAPWRIVFIVEDDMTCE